MYLILLFMYNFHNMTLTIRIMFNRGGCQPNNLKEGDITSKVR